MQTLGAIFLVAGLVLLGMAFTGQAQYYTTLWTGIFGKATPPPAGSTQPAASTQPTWKQLLDAITASK